jgi:hypothetical protein
MGAHSTIKRLKEQALEGVMAEERQYRSMVASHQHTLTQLQARERVLHFQPTKLFDESCKAPYSALSQSVC